MPKPARRAFLLRLSIVLLVPPGSAPRIPRRIQRHARPGGACRFQEKGKLDKRLASLYDGIVFGPVSAPAAQASPIEGDRSQARAAHWRHGHIRMQVHGPMNQLRKLIFTMPLLVHADELTNETPPLRSDGAASQGHDAGHNGPRRTDAGFLQADEV